jgi:iron complex outermembrane receptor protein
VTSLTLILFAGQLYAQPADLADLTLEQLASIEITSASRRSEPLAQTPAAAYVISRDDIRRSGANSIPEALRLAPAVEVTRNGAQTWTITIRGFNSDLSNKLLVLIDGRSAYSPLYAGVFWDVQDVLLEDVDRIEVIAGPGGTMWGANAVNGVINIITRSASETPGGHLEVGTGNEETMYGGLRYGWDTGEDMSARVYIKYAEGDASRDAGAPDRDAVDAWNMLRGGFRIDWLPAPGGSMMLQGNAYGGERDAEFMDDFTLGTLPGENIIGDTEASGADLLWRWRRVLNNGSEATLQLYYDYTRRAIPNQFTEERDTFDLDFQHHIQAGRHEIVWGAEFHLTGDEIENSLFSSFIPDSRTDETYSFFLQDEIDLWRQRLFVTLGSKFVHNDYTGFEYQPNARLTWLATEEQTLWAAVSRAVRIPARLNEDLQLTLPVDIGIPLYVTVAGSGDYDSEEVIAWEAGYRLQPRADLTFDLALFYNDYDYLQTQEPGPITPVSQPPLLYLLFPFTLSNLMQGESYGATIMGSWRPRDNWRIRADYTYFDLHLHTLPESGNPEAEDLEGNSPENQFSLHSFLDLPYKLELYSGVRWIDNLPSQDVKSYIALDLSLRWIPAEHIELSVTARNLADRTHLEFGDSNLIERSVYGRLVWHF